MVKFVLTNDDATQWVEERWSVISTALQLHGFSVIRNRVVIAIREGCCILYEITPLEFKRLMNICMNYSNEILSLSDFRLSIKTTIRSFNDNKVSIRLV